jgi:hypothetical protein
MHMMMMSHCYAPSSFLLLAFSLRLWPRDNVLARVIPRRRRRMANIFKNDTSASGAYGEAAGLLLPAWATMEEADVLQARRSKGNNRLGSPPLKKQVFQQQAAGQPQPPLRVPAEYEPVSTGTFLSYVGTRVVILLLDTHDTPSVSFFQQSNIHTNNHISLIHLFFILLLVFIGSHHGME